VLTLEKLVYEGRNKAQYARCSPGPTPACDSKAGSPLSTYRISGLCASITVHQRMIQPTSVSSVTPLIGSSWAACRLIKTLLPSKY
jgi:hypothetical protein